MIAKVARNIVAYCFWLKQYKDPLITRGPPLQAASADGYEDFKRFNYSSVRLRGTSLRLVPSTTDGISGIITRPTARITLKSPAEPGRFCPRAP